jgi:Tol biopolymer transport system component
MRRKSSFFIFLVAGMILVSLACNLTAQASGTPFNEETAVAGTVAALTPVNPSSTPEAHAVPTTTAAPVVTPVRVSFVDSARNLYVWTEGSAAPVELVSSRDVTDSFVSSDGSLIAFSRGAVDMSNELDVINADGTNQRVLINTAAFAALPHPADSTGLVPYKLAWIPNSHRLAMSVRITFEGPGLQIGDTLYSIDADSGTFSALSNPGQNFDFSFSPDGSWLVITRPTGVDLYSATGALVAANAVSHEFVNTASEYAWTALPAWQNDSSNFAVAIAPKEPWGDAPGASAVWKVTTTGAATNTYNGSMGFFPAGIASFNPDLTRMVFTTRVGAAADNNWALHIANIDGSADTLIDTGYFGKLPVWSPDGSKFIYTKLVGSTRQAYLVQSGSVPTLLGDITSLIDVRWLDNTRYIVSSRMAGGSSLLLGTVGSPSGVIFNDPTVSDQQGFSFDVNR